MRATGVKEEKIMTITEVKSRTPDLIDQLLEVWEGSVRATHLFLSEDEIKRIREYVPQAKGFYEHMGFQVYKRTDLDEQGSPYPLLYMRLTHKPVGRQDNRILNQS